MPGRRTVTATVIVPPGEAEGVAMRALILAAAATAGACGAPMPEAGSAPVGGNEVVAPAAEKGMQDGIIGKYVVTYVDGAPPTINIEGHEPTVTIGKERIHFQSQCIYADWTYERDGETISTKPFLEPGSGMCARGLAPGEIAIQAGFREASTIRRIRGGLYVEGKAHRLQLRRLIDQASVASRAVDLAGEWRVAELDGEEIDKRNGIALSANHEEIWWEPGCALQSRNYTIRGSRFDTQPDGPSGSAVCDIGIPAELPRIWSAIDAAEKIQRTQANAVLISGRGRSVVLFAR